MTHPDSRNLIGWGLVSLALTVALLAAAAGFVALLSWNRIVFALVLSHATAYGAGVVTRDQRRRLLAFSHHFLGEEVEAVHGADLDADVAAERALRLSGEVDQIEVEPFMADSGYRPPVHVDRLVWCVLHRDGWCATADGTEPVEGSTFVETLCGACVYFPWGYDRRLPDCVECEAFVRHNDEEDELTDIYGIPATDDLGQLCAWYEDGTTACGDRAEGWARWPDGEPVWLCGVHLAWHRESAESDGRIDR